MPITPNKSATVFAPNNGYLTTGGTATSVSGLLALLVTSLSEVIGASVDNDSAAKNALGTDQLDQLVSDRAGSIALAVSLEVAEITDVTLLVRGSSVGLAMRVDWSVSASIDPRLESKN